jgi:hypothetical protein
MTGNLPTAPTPGDSFAHAAGAMSAGLPIAKHKQGRFEIGKGAETLPLGTRAAAHAIRFGMIKFNGAGNAPRRIIATPGSPLPDRGELGDTDPELWPVDRDGKPSDPWAEFCEMSCTRLDTGAGFILSATAPSAIRAMAALARQIVWGRQEQGQAAVPVIELQVQKVQGQAGTFYAPIYPVISWIHENAGQVKEVQTPSQPVGGVAQDGDGLGRAQRALKKRLSGGLADELDDKLPF